MLSDGLQQCGKRNERKEKSALSGMAKDTYDIFLYYEGKWIDAEQSVTVK